MKRSKHHRILIIDDNESNLELLREILSQHPYDLRTCISAEEAFHIVKTFKPELILADIQLPGMSGLEFARCLKSDPSLKNTVVLALTAYVLRGYELNALAAGCDGYLTKPVDTRLLPGIVEGYLNKLRVSGGIS